MRDKDEQELAEEIDIPIDNLLHWLDVYMNTRNSIIPSIELQRKVMGLALQRASDAIIAQRLQYEVEEAKRVKRREEEAASGEPKKGWTIHSTGARMGVNWSVVERFEQEDFEDKKRFFLYRKQHSELMCECVDDERASCEKCYGTGFDGGWKLAGSFPAVDVVNEGALDEKDRVIEALYFRASFFRTLRPGDVVVDEDNMRWRVINVEGLAKDNPSRYEGWNVYAFTVHPTLMESKFPLTHNEKTCKELGDAE